MMIDALPMKGTFKDTTPFAEWERDKRYNFRQFCALGKWKELNDQVN